MTFALDLPTCPPSFWQRLDPRWKLAGLLSATLACALVQTWGPSLAALGGGVLAAATARLPWRWYVRRLAGALVLFLLFLIWLPLVVEEGDATLDVGVLTLSLTGLERLVVLGAKLGGLVSLMLVLVASSPLQDTFKAAQALGIPGLFIQLVLLTHRYVFLLMEELARLRIALRVRGFRNRADGHSYRTIGQVAGTLLVRSHERSERVAQAMRCRGFDGRFRSLQTFRTAGRDIVVFLILALGAIGLVTWDGLAR